MKGSYTVEAAILFPLVLFSVFLIWFLGFYKHNQTACQAICREAVYIGLEAGRCGKEEEAAMLHVLTEQSKHLLGVSAVEKQVSVKDNELTAKLEVTMYVPFGFLINNNFLDTWEVTGEASVSSRNPVNVVRQMRRMGVGEWQSTGGN